MTHLRPTSLTGLFAAALLLAPLPLDAAQSTQNLNARVGAAWGESSSLEGRPAAERQVLARAVLDRGEFLGDVSELAVRLGADYGALRDTSQVIEATAANALYAGVHDVLLGRGASATEQLGSSLDLPPALEGIRSGWLAAAGNRASGGTAPSGAPVSWAGVVNAVKATDDVCPAPVRESLRHGRCTIHLGVTSGDVARVREGQRFLESRPIPDHVERGGDDYWIEYHDASTHILMELGDWWIAARALEGETAPAVRIARASALVRSGQPAAARQALEGIDDPVADVYRGAAEALSGDLRAAEVRWSRVVSAGGDPALMALDQMTRFGLGGDMAVQRLEEDRSRGFEGYSRRRALLLGRALLRTGDPVGALEVLEASYPRSAHNDLTQIPPEYLVALAHARYLAGRDHWPEARQHLVVLARAYPSITGLLTMMQEITAPERTRSERSRPGP